MNTVNKMRLAELKTDSELQMSVKRVKVKTDGIPCEDKILFSILGYCAEHEIDIDEYVVISMSEAKRLIGILELMTMN